MIREDSNFARPCNWCNTWVYFQMLSQTAVSVINDYHVKICDDSAVI